MYIIYIYIGIETNMEHKILHRRTFENDQNFFFYFTKPYGSYQYFWEYCFTKSQIFPYITK